MYRETGAIELSHPPGPSRTVRTTTAANKVKRWLNAKRKKSVRILARKLHVGRESVRKIIKLDLLCKPYKVCKQPKLTEGHKIRRVQFSNWIRNNFKKSDTSRIKVELSRDLNPLDYSIWNEIVQGMNWDRVECKESLKAQIMLSVKKIRPQVVLDSCTSFYTRVRRVATSDGSYLQK